MKNVLNEESIKLIELMIEDGLITQQNVEKYYHELRASKDERIRKGLIEFINNPTLLLPHKKKEYIDWLKSLKNTIQPQPKQEWSEEDDIEQDVILNALMEFETYGGDFSKAKNWIISLSKRFNLQQKLTWSEDDDRMVETIIGHLERLKNYHTYTTNIEQCQNWLKSLRPQNRWKPTKEQIIALRWVLNHIPYNVHKEEISGLLDQIKDL